MKCLILSLVVAVAAVAFVPACAVLTPGSTTQPVQNNSTAYLAGQVQYWQRIVDALQKQLDDPAAPANPTLKKDLAAARWWLNWFSLALAAASAPA